MICSVCNNNKHELHPKKSKLMDGMTLLLCNSCLDSKKEPRFVVVLHGRANGIQSVSSYIKEHRYAGADITASELV